MERAARGGVAAGIGIGVSALLQFAFVVIATRVLRQSAVGALVEAIAIFTIASLTFGADLGLLRFVPIFRRRRPSDVGRLHVVALLPALCGSVALAVAVYLCAPQLVHVFFRHVTSGGSVTALRTLTYFLPAATLSAVLCASVRTSSMRASVVAQNFVQASGRIVLILIFVAFGVTLRLATIAYAVPLVASVLVAAVLVAWVVRGGPTDSVAPSSYLSLAGEFWRFSILSLFGMVFVSMISSLDVLLVGAILSARLAAAYSVASRYLIAGTFALQAITQSVSRRMSTMMDRHDYQAVKLVYRSSTWWTMVVSWPPLIVLAVFAPLFLSVFGHGYLVAVPALSILALSMLANTGTGANSVLLQMAGRSGLALAMLGGGLAINVGLDLWLIPVIGINGAAIGWMATIMEIAVVTNLILWRNYRIHPFGDGYWVAAVASLGCFGVLGLVVRAAFGTGIGTFFGYAVVSSTLYAVVLLKNRTRLNLDAFESLYGKLLRRARRARLQGSANSTSVPGRGTGFSLRRRVPAHRRRRKARPAPEAPPLVS